MWRKMASVLTSLFLVSSLLMGCGGIIPAGRSQTPEDTVIFARGADSISLDPVLIEDIESAKVVANVFDTLVRYKEGSTEVEPALATEWSTSEDGKEWTFKLRQGVKFHDGTPFNAEAVKFNMDRQLPPNRTEEMPYSSFTLGMVDKVVAVDDYTVKFILKTPYSPFLLNLAMPFSVPIGSPEAIKKMGKDFGAHPVGTGPYIFESWEKDAKITLKANPDYWGGKPNIDKLVFEVIKEKSLRADKLIAGDVDIIDGVAPEDVERLKGDEHLNVSLSPGMNISYMGMRTDRKPFNDPKVRQAISMAINRKELVKALYQGNALVANGPLPPSLLGYDKTIQPYPYDPAKAKELLREAGYDDNLSFDLITYSDSRPYNTIGGDNLAVAIQGYMKEVGITVNITSAPWKEYKQNLQDGQGDAYLYGWTGDNGDPDNFLYVLLHSSQITSLNYSKYKNPNYDELLEKAQQTSNIQERIKDYSSAQQILVKDAPWLFISTSMNITAANKRISGFSIHPTGVCFLRDVVKG
ncbi:ABC-type dipeptide transport system, periplasmic component [Desulfosporosinus orientis DSM 765]|uniref:ABC-type dipeptide transport system, periplasmic component n=1 Tax=Desulfosporosinus orientis (strain ATCC 19365 / DSM 765 / NCIMB 8382 / VKM B-1628 / Singapore I) TaxID=768706 RepID=G7WGE3_DESOD|nr:ABC transporter substrate-binding protein [Desulfosporosinus orientis]AET70875.1 ABC-type dipeptide transport system, periplasmic component [Desulfosporosinus orientis DSM 765]